MPTPPPRMTRKEVRRLFRYNPQTGHFYWKNRTEMPLAWNTRYAHKRAGTNVRRGCRHIKINSYTYKEHQLAFLYMTGRQPKEIDHINKDATDNRWTNLRACTRRQNNFNKGPYGKTGVKGVYYASTNRFKVLIRIQGKLTYLGLYPTLEEANKVYCRAAEKEQGAFAHHLSERCER